MASYRDRVADTTSWDTARVTNSHTILHSLAMRHHPPRPSQHVASRGRHAPRPSSSSQRVVASRGHNERHHAPWPAQPSAHLGAQLFQLGSAGASLAADARALVHSRERLAEFLEVYTKRPSRFNHCGIRLNHALALWLITKRTAPKYILESGVNAGVSTFMLRAAAPHARIAALDPAAAPICGQRTRWIDSKLNASRGVPLTTYHTGANFTDLLAVDWPRALTVDDNRAARAAFWRDTLVYEPELTPPSHRLVHTHLARAPQCTRICCPCSVTRVHARVACGAPTCACAWLVRGAPAVCL